jgi:hypothetical protein
VIRIILQTISNFLSNLKLEIAHQNLHNNLTILIYN